jgi:hypothetical protein
MEIKYIYLCIHANAALTMGKLDVDGSAPVRLRTLFIGVPKSMSSEFIRDANSSNGKSEAPSAFIAREGVALAASVDLNIARSSSVLSPIVTILK